MTDDDRRLADLLRRYEGRVPVDADAAVVTGPRRPPWAPLAAGVAVVIGLVLISVLVRQPPHVGDLSHTPAQAASGEPTPTLIPTASTIPTPPPTASATPPPTAAATVAPTPETADGPVARWAPTAVFSSEGWAEEILDMTFGAGHFIAIGYREPDDQRGHVGPPIDEPRIWISPDGRSWDPVDPGPAFEHGHPRSIVALADGSAVAYGSIDPPPPANPRSAAWRTTDGRTWTPLELSLPHDGPQGRVVGGPHGLLSVSSINTEDSVTEEVWHSVDGAAWSVVHRVEPRDGFMPSLSDWEGGPEGFVVTGYRYRFVGDVREEQAFVLASGDGIEWFEAPPNETAFSTYTRVAPIGGDWLIAANETADGNWTGRATTWFSANGLAWEERAAIDIPIPAPPWEGAEPSAVVGHLANTGERVIASANVVVCCHGPAWGGGVWSSFDGRSWERLGFPDGTVVTAAAEHDGVVVLAGFDRARPEDEFEARAVFWIGEQR